MQDQDDQDLFSQPFYGTSLDSGPASDFSSHAHAHAHAHAGPSGSTSSSYDPFHLGDLDAAQLGITLPPADDGDDDGDTPGTTSSTDDSRKRKGGRPRDKVWDLFDGDRTFASCKHCDWKSEHPKAVRMKAHVLTQCPAIPASAKLAFLQYDEDKARTKQLQHEYEQEQARQLAANRAAKADAERKRLNSIDSAGPPPLPPPGTQQRGQESPASKKVKKEHRTVTAHNGPPPSLSTSFDMTSNQSNSAIPRPPQSPAPRSPITCHVLDSTCGKPAPEMRIRLDRLNTSGFVLQGQGVTDKDGRCNTLLPPGTVLEVGIFKITFFTSEYFTHRGILSFYPFVEIPFEVKSPEEHYHIPCLLAPHSYTTYRGS
ncbi:hypothetical protein JCM11491_001200 [Sporobolomyces phaffii]